MCDEEELEEREYPTEDEESGINLTEISKNFNASYTQFQSHMERAEEDIKFVHGRQWSEQDQAMREQQRRPVITINKLRQPIDQITGSFRQNLPRIKVVPQKDATVENAKVIDSVMRYIEQINICSQKYRMVFSSQIKSGMGALVIGTEYSSWDSFDQDITIDVIDDPTTIFPDPNMTMPDGSDMDWCYITSYMNKKEFESRYPGAPVTQAASIGPDNSKDWTTNDQIRVADYWKKCLKKEMVVFAVTTAFPEGVVLTESEFNQYKEQDPEGVREIKRREALRPVVYWSKVSGSAILEGPKRCIGTQIPVVLFTGRKSFDSELKEFRGCISDSKDAQRLHNYYKSQEAEAAASHTKAPWILSPEQIKGYEAQWAESAKVPKSYLLYNYIEGIPVPQQLPGPQASTALVEGARSAAEDIKATTGYFDAALGAKSREISGRAITARQMQSDNGSFEFIDNFTLALQRLGRIIVSWIPTVYDTERTLTIIKDDDSQEQVNINEAEYDEAGKVIKILNEINSKSKFDIYVDTSAGFNTKRQEASANMVELTKYMPSIGEVAPDLLVKAQDWPYAKEFADRLRALLPPEVKMQSMTEEEKANYQQELQQQQQEQERQAQMELAKMQYEAEEKKMALQKTALEVQKAETELNKSLQENAKMDKAEIEKLIAKTVKAMGLV